MTAAVLERPSPVTFRRPRLIPAPEIDPPLTLVPAVEPEWPLAAPTTVRQLIPAQRRVRESRPTAMAPRIDCRRFAPAPRRLSAPAAQPAATQMNRIRQAETPDWSTDIYCGVQRTPTAALPSATDWATVCCRGIIESLAGRRSVDQLRKHCSPEIFTGLKERAPSQPTSPALLLTITVCQPADGIAEVAAVFRTRGRAHAMALRMQGLDGHWRITDLQMA